MFFGGGGCFYMNKGYLLAGGYGIIYSGYFIFNSLVISYESKTI